MGRHVLSALHDKISPKISDNNSWWKNGIKVKSESDRKLDEKLLEFIRQKQQDIIQHYIDVIRNA